jgi:DNA processing protein
MKVAKNQPGAVAAASGFEIIPISDERYPPLLRTICDPPDRLYVRGDPSLLSEPQLALVGSRRASAAGLRAARLFSGQAVAAGLHVCSGLALGIDGASHRGALAAGGKSIAVMATGIDQVYPARHRELADDLLQAGCLVTEFAPGMPPHRGNFPRRNRIISGLSLGVLVVEAALPSGSLITAGTALEQGREVFALPWSMLHKGGAGCLHLIRDGVKMVQRIDDVLEELGPLYALQQELFVNEGLDQAASVELSAGQRSLLRLVGFEAVSLEELVGLSGKPVERLLVELSSLELAGLVVRCPGGYIRS